jgi:hypothetical protein
MEIVMTDKMRVAFEKWAKDNKAELMGDWNGKPYVDYAKTEIAWEAWQAREPEIAELKARMNVAEKALTEAKDICCEIDELYGDIDTFHAYPVNTQPAQGLI